MSEQNIGEITSQTKKLSRRNFLKGAAFAGVATGLTIKKMFDNLGLFTYKGIEFGVKHEWPLNNFIEMTTTAIAKKAIIKFHEKGNDLTINPNLYHPITDLIEDAINLSNIPIKYQYDKNRNTTDYYWEKFTERRTVEFPTPSNPENENIVPSIEESMASITGNDIYDWLLNKSPKKDSKVYTILRDLHLRGQDLWGNYNNTEFVTLEEKDLQNQNASAPIFNWQMVGGIDGSGYAKRKNNPKELAKYTHLLLDSAYDNQGTGYISRVLATAIKENQGQLHLALWDTSTAMKLMARNDLDTAQFIANDHPDIIVQRFKNWKDEFSLLGTNFMLQGDPDNQDKDLSIVNKVGLYYHVLNTMALLSKYPRQIIKMSVLGSQLYEIQCQGLVKTASDLLVIQQLRLVESYFKKFQ